MNGKKSTIVNRANHRPKAQLDKFMLHTITTKLLKFLHTKTGKVVQGAATKLGVFLVTNGYVSADDQQKVIGAIAVLLGEFLDWVVFQINRRFTKDLQVKEGLTPDAFPGPVTRIVADVPHLNPDGTPILKAIPTEPKP